MHQRSHERHAQRTGAPSIPGFGSGASEGLNKTSDSSPGEVRGEDGEWAVSFWLDILELKVVVALRKTTMAEMHGSRTCSWYDALLLGTLLASTNAGNPRPQNSTENVPRSLRQLSRNAYSNYITLSLT